MLCPVCNKNWDEGTTQCPICGRDLTTDSDKIEWVILGDVDDRISADFAKETLNSYNIPAVIFSKSGFFGNVGLPLHPFYKPGSGVFEIAVQNQYQEDALEILEMILGDKWHTKEN